MHRKVKDKTDAPTESNSKLSFEEFRTEVKKLADKGMLPSAIALKLNVRMKMVARVWPKAWPNDSELKRTDGDETPDEDEII